METLEIMRIKRIIIIFLLKDAVGARMEGKE
jgi:hypothetical protein